MSSRRSGRAARRTGRVEGQGPEEQKTGGEHREKEGREEEERRESKEEEESEEEARREEAQRSVAILAQVHCTLNLSQMAPSVALFNATPAAQLAWPAAGGVCPVLNFGAVAASSGTPRKR